MPRDRRRVLLLVNPSKPKAVEAESTLVGLIERYGTLAGIERDWPTDGPAPAHPDADLVVVLGGDGSIISAARSGIGGDAPLLGVNFGKLGFMAGFELQSIAAHAEVIFGGDEIRTRPVYPIEADITGADGTTERVRAVNEVVITAGRPYRMIRLDIEMDGQGGPTLEGDGLIIATPMGSTAHNASAGGPIVAPGPRALVITPIAANSLGFRPIVLQPQKPVRVRLEELNEETTLVIDGQAHRALQTGGELRVACADLPIEFVTNPDAPYWTTLMSKMRWAQRPARE